MQTGQQHEYRMVIHTECQKGSVPLRMHYPSIMYICSNLSAFYSETTNVYIHLTNVVNCPCNVDCNKHVHIYTVPLIPHMYMYTIYVHVVIKVACITGMCVLHVEHGLLCSSVRGHPFTVDTVHSCA